MRNFYIGLLLLMAASPCPALWAGESDATHLLRYKFKAGEVIHYEVDQRSRVRNTMEGTTQEAQTKTVSLKAWKVIDVTPSGEIEFINLVERVRMQNKLPDRAEMIFDSTEGKEPPPGFEDAAKAVGVPLSAIRMSARGEVIDRDIKHHQPASDPHEMVVLLLPEGPVAIGASWIQPQEITVKIQDGGVKMIKARRKLKLQSVANGVAVIETEFQVLSPTSPAIDGQLAHRMMKGTVRFDINEGRILSQELAGDRRVLGFAGPSSSMRLESKLNERIKAGPRRGGKPALIGYSILGATAGLSSSANLVSGIHYWASQQCHPFVAIGNYHSSR